MAIILTHIFEQTDDGVLDHQEHSRLGKECPAMNLPGVVGGNLYRHVGKPAFYGDVELENYAALDTWEAWWLSPEGQEWVQKFGKTGKFVERIILEKVEYIALLN